MKREQLLSRLRRYCRRSGLAFESSAKRGKGSHITVRVGDRTTTVKMGDLTPGYVALLLRQLDLPQDALRQGEETMRFCYPVDLTDDGDGLTAAHGVLVTFPDFPEANTFGDDRRDALASAVDCLEEALAGRICDRAVVPEPSPARGRPTVAPGGLVGAKTALYLALGAIGLSQAELARRMGVRPTTVQRLLDPRHASKPEQFDAAFAALGKRLVVSVENAA